MARVTLVHVREGDVELARACAAGDGQALAELERRTEADIRRALARLRLDAAAADDVRQVVREKLFVAKDGKPAGILSYQGKGPLGAFVRAVVVHAAIASKRRVRVADGDSAIERMASFEDPELVEIRSRFGAAFKQAFQDAFKTVAARDRNVLRLVYVDGLTVEQVGAAYGVHRVTVSRWLGDVRSALQNETRRLLGERLALTPSEAKSLTRLCLSEIDLSLSRLLRE